MPSSHFAQQTCGRRRFPQRLSVNGIVMAIVALQALTTYSAEEGVAGLEHTGRGVLLDGASGEGAVVELASETFDDFIKVNKFAVVEFYAPWCGHCKKFAPEYAIVAEALHRRGVQAGRVDAIAEEAIAMRYQVEGFPSVYLFRNGRPEEYSGTRTNASIVNWVMEMTGPALKMLPSLEALNVTLRTRRSLPCVVFREGTLKALVVFRLAAEQISTMAQCFAVEGEAKEDVSPGQIQIYKGINEIIEFPLKDSIGTVDSLTKVLRLEIIPLFGEIGEANYDPYFEKLIGMGDQAHMLWVCFEPDYFREDVVRLNQAFRQVALYFPKFVVAYLDTKVYEEHVLEELGVRALPALVLQVGNFSSSSSQALKRYKFQLPMVLKEAVADIGERGSTHVPEVSSSQVITWLLQVSRGQVSLEDEADLLDFDDDEDVYPLTDEASMSPSNNAGSNDAGSGAETQHSDLAAGEGGVEGGSGVAEPSPASDESAASGASGDGAKRREEL